MRSNEVVIVADPNGTNFGFVEKICENIKNKSGKDFPMKLVPLEILVFRDGERKVRVTENVRGRECFFIHDSNKEPAVWALELNFVNEALKNSDAYKITDVLPYLRFSRQDRKDKSRVAQNAKIIAKNISDYANRMMTLDIHAVQIPGFYDVPVDPLYSVPVVVEYLYEKHKSFVDNAVIMSPDTGGATRAESLLKKLSKKGIETTMVIGYKKREKEGVVSDKYQILGDVNGKNVLILDDIIDSGGTLLKAYQELKINGAKEIWAYATHGLFTGGVEKLTNVFDKVLISDTLFVKPHEKLEVVSLTDLFGEAIYRTIKGDSLSSLFDISQ